MDNTNIIVIVLTFIYLVLGLNPPLVVAQALTSLAGHIAFFVLVVYIILNTHGVSALLVLALFDMMRRAHIVVSNTQMKQFNPSEERKTSQFSAFNQFPYTLEQEVVKRMAPMVRTGASIDMPKFKPTLDNAHNASSVSNI